MADERIDRRIESNGRIRAISKYWNGCFDDVEEGMNICLKNPDPLLGFELGDVGDSLLCSVIQYSDITL